MWATASSAENARTAEKTATTGSVWRHQNRAPSTDREAKPHAQKGRQQDPFAKHAEDPDLTGNPANEGELQSQNAESGEAKLEASGSAAESFLELLRFSFPEPAPRSFYGVLCLARSTATRRRLRCRRDAYNGGRYLMSEPSAFPIERRELGHLPSRIASERPSGENRAR